VKTDKRQQTKDTNNYVCRLYSVAEKESIENEKSRKNMDGWHPGQLG
jgi:hypothetical protein